MRSLALVLGANVGIVAVVWLAYSVRYWDNPLPALGLLLIAIVLCAPGVKWSQRQHWPKH